MVMALRELERINEDDAILSNNFDIEDDIDEQDSLEKPGGAQTRADSSEFLDDEHYKNLDATQLYLNEIGFSPLLSAEEEVYFARRALKGHEPSRKRMIESNLRLVVKISRRYVNRGLALLDLIEEGNL